jgi:hypothetical protein
MVGTPELAALKIAGSTSALCILVHVREFLDLANRCVLEVPLLNFIPSVAPRNSNVFIRATGMCAQKFPGSGIFYRRYIVSCRTRD